MGNPEPKNVSIPKITKDQTANFAKVWNNNGIAILLDATAIQFATDWCNIVLASFIEDQVKKFAARAAAMQPPVGTQEVLPPDTPVPAKSNIVVVE
jgi:hypothetical protein